MNTPATHDIITLDGSHEPNGVSLLTNEKIKEALFSITNHNCAIIRSYPMLSMYESAIMASCPSQ